MESKSSLFLKAKLLCEGANPDEGSLKLFQKQNPSNVKRGGLSCGGKIRLEGGLFVNFPLYLRRKTEIKIRIIKERKSEILLVQDGKSIARGEILSSPKWYKEKIGRYKITQILTAHNRQLVGAIYEDCVLFSLEKQCQFCVMRQSLLKRDSALVKKSGELFLEALRKIPLEEYGGLTLNGGMTLGAGRGMEIIEPVIRTIHKTFPKIPIAVEITPPRDLIWIDRLAEAGISSLMMNLECWDISYRARLIPGKNEYCPRDQYLSAFERAVKVLGPGRVSTCFIVGTEPLSSLKEGIQEVIAYGVIPSLLAGRYFEEVPAYPFVPDNNWREFLKIAFFTKEQLLIRGIRSCDKAGCVACRMCDLISDLF